MCRQATSRKSRSAALAKELGTAAVYVQLDVTNKSVWERAIARCTVESRSLNCLVSNADINYGND